MAAPRPEDALRDGMARARSEAGRMRHALRGLALPLFTWPLFWDAMVEVVRGNAAGLAAAALGLVLPWMAVREIRLGAHGAAARAALWMAGCTFAVAWLGAGHGPVMSGLLAAGGWLGTRLLYDGAYPEAARPAPPPPPGPLADAALRLARIEGVAARLGQPGLTDAAGAMAGVLRDLGARPERLGQARRFLAVHLDGLDRIADRLDAGATPPPGLPGLLRDLEAAAQDLRRRIQAEETEALDIQVKVLSDRLRQEGYA